MDIQLRRGLLDYCVLGVLKEEETYGYNIIKKWTVSYPYRNQRFIQY